MVDMAILHNQNSIILMQTTEYHIAGYFRGVYFSCLFLWYRDIACIFNSRKFNQKILYFHGWSLSNIDQTFDPRNWILIKTWKLDPAKLSLYTNYYFMLEWEQKHPDIILTIAVFLLHISLFPQFHCFSFSTIQLQYFLMTLSLNVCCTV